MFIDRAGPDMGVTPAAADAFLRDVLAPFGLEGAHAVLCDGGQEVLGVGRDQLLSRVRDAAVFINVMGFVRDPAVLEAARRPVFLDIDPGFPQMWSALGLADLFANHEVFLTVGANIGSSQCEVPTCGLQWIATRPPVVLEQWPVTAGDRRFTTVGAWRGPFAPVAYSGRSYGLRVHEFRRFATLPLITGRDFGVALDIHPEETKDITMLNENGWALVDPDVGANPAAYRSFIQGSGAEFSVAENMHVQARTGWFSDRSVCYLASGKPVVAQDTGLGWLGPTGEGLLRYGTVEEAAAAVDSVAEDYVRHSRAARALAEE